MSNESSACLNILAYNISSIPRHLDRFIEQCLYACNMNFDILGFCETRLNDTICNLYNIDGYSSHFSNRNTNGGGLAVYIPASRHAEWVN